MLRALVHGRVREDVDCWMWAGSVKGQGYGVVQIGGRRYAAHRLSYFAFHGIDPLEYHVCHTCDRPACVNPAHLFCGTATDNMRDCSAKGRVVIPRFDGEANIKAKLTEDQVIDIRARRSQGARTTVLAAEYGISQVQVCNIVGRRSWAHVA